MSKNITIAEGNQAKNFYNASFLKTNLIGGGTQYWVPEDEAGKYANVDEITITENGTYSARDEDLDGFSSVRVNVAGGGGDEPVLITKNITSNGTYNASDDDADGYSSVIVNVPNSHGNVIIDGLDRASVSQKISTKDFFYDFDEKLYFSIESALTANTSASWVRHVEQQVRENVWLQGQIMNRLMGYNNLVILASGGQTGSYNYDTAIWFYVFGIADDSAYVTIENATANGCTITISDDTKFYSAGSTGPNVYEWRYPNTGVGGFGQAEAAMAAIDNHQLWGNTGLPNTITISRPDPTLIGKPGTNLMTNLIGG